jgi:hypothetical protein
MTPGETLLTKGLSSALYRDNNLAVAFIELLDYVRKLESRDTAWREDVAATAWREAIEGALGVESDSHTHTPEWAAEVVHSLRRGGTRA